ncbi:hypothetical protein AB0I72_19495 [Nocardiopsis sp. NPDC049922]|uniref:hypothetical protein n=1 Tax=Nocardiopsis sp. NPDC049922 TaxID=3155157 RepID=UPI003411C7E4
MGTRGFFGTVAGGREAISYVHWAAHPEGLGLDVLRWLRTADVESARARAARMRVVAPDTQPSLADIEKYLPHADLTVSTQSLEDWYALLRGTQGDPDAILSAGIVEDASEFPLDSLWCEWRCLVDFDAAVLETYVGYQCQPHDRGRFARRRAVHAAHGYYPLARGATFPLSALPDDEAFLNACEGV